MNTAPFGQGINDGIERQGNTPERKVEPARLARWRRGRIALAHGLRWWNEQEVRRAVDICPCCVHWRQRREVRS
ncbi:MAG: hypothetical protein ACR2PL_02760 [Dehalococcoidia bacterium]